MSESETMPWNEEPLCYFDIVGMNHYYQRKQRRLFVAMTTKIDGIGLITIKAEGKDERRVFASLKKQAERWIT